MKNAFSGCGPFLHDDPDDRTPAIYGGTTTLHAGAGRENFLLVPIVPPKSCAGSMVAGVPLEERVRQIDRRTSSALRQRRRKLKLNALPR
jgi:hypothetical protein